MLESLDSNLIKLFGLGVLEILLYSFICFHIPIIAIYYGLYDYENRSKENFTRNDITSAVFGLMLYFLFLLSVIMFNHNKDNNVSNCYYHALMEKHSYLFHDKKGYRYKPEDVEYYVESYLEDVKDSCYSKYKY